MNSVHVIICKYNGLMLDWFNPPGRIDKHIITIIIGGKKQKYDRHTMFVAVMQGEGFIEQGIVLFFSSSNLIKQIDQQSLISAWIGG